MFVSFLYTHLKVFFKVFWELCNGIHHLVWKWVWNFRKTFPLGFCLGKIKTAQKWCSTTTGILGDFFLWHKHPIEKVLRNFQLDCIFFPKPAFIFIKLFVDLTIALISSFLLPKFYPWRITFSRESLRHSEKALKRTPQVSTEKRLQSQTEWFRFFNLST